MQRSAVRPSPLFYIIVAVTIVGGVLVTLQSPLELVQYGNVITVDREPQPLGTAGIVLLVLGGWAVSLILHEFGHAFVAYKGGDHEVAIKGYLSMDIRRYTDPVFSIVLPLLILVIGGVPLPGGAVWINQWALRSRAVACRVSLAGPLSNLALGILLTAAVVLIDMPAGLLMGLSYLATLQILAFVLNILPVPGLDGYGAIEPYLSPQAREFGAKARPWAPLILFALIFAVPQVGYALWDVTHFIFGLAGGEEVFSNWGQFAFMFWKNL
ncbi:site-2 protease family protein [Amycolatopsis suaedae]|uniref:Site-2 protease family protein n=1 Tax=Amycolatopsis suaedae TaxID=2510978 RepID=A0A4Q7JBG0_9PSEU|nr:site-2 protease family protein [Amycolatopsis suaedae]RZQ63594.1 site-2 protease family protein [Amycolatopsis suaedae]